MVLTVDCTLVVNGSFIVEYGSSDTAVFITTDVCTAVLESVEVFSAELDVTQADGHTVDTIVSSKLELLSTKHAVALT